MAGTPRTFENDKYKEASLYEWQLFFAGLYDKQNSTRSLDNLWLNAIQDMSKVAEALRKPEYEPALKNLAYVFCWSSVFAIEAGGPLDDIVWNKFPGVCLYCADESTQPFTPCKCSPGVEKVEDKKPIKELRQHFSSQKENMPASLDKWIEMFDKIYSSRRASLDERVYHLMEEMGEVPEALQELHEFNKIRHRIGKSIEDQEKLKTHFEQVVKDEIADVFSWICSVVSKLFEIINPIKKSETTFSERLFIEFPNCCWRCGENPCICTIRTKLNGILAEYAKRSLE